MMRSDRNRPVSESIVLSSVSTEKTWVAKGLGYFLSIQLSVCTGEYLWCQLNGTQSARGDKAHG